MTFDEDGVAERVSRRQHEICGQQVRSEIFYCCIAFVLYVILYKHLAMCIYILGTRNPIVTVRVSNLSMYSWKSVKGLVVCFDGV